MRHYFTFCEAVFLHDFGSSDGTQEIARKFGAKIIQHDGKGEFSDSQNKLVKNICWHGTDADWCVVCDCDELMYFPAGAETTLTAYLGQGVEVVKPIGYDMTSDVFPTGDGQIYDYVKHGKREADWYSKPALFCPKRVASLDFGTGAHVVSVTAKDGRKFMVDQRTPPNSPSTFLLHFHHLGSVEKIGEKYDATRARMSAENVRMRWGNLELGIKHARDKRSMILSGLERVVP